MSSTKAIAISPITNAACVRERYKEMERPPAFSDSPIFTEALLRAGFKDEDLDGTWQPFGPKGCDICKNTGYKGRVGIYQVMEVTEAIGRLIMSGGNAIDIADQAAKEGVWDLRRSGLEKVRAGMTSLEEVNSVTIE